MPSPKPAADFVVDLMRGPGGTFEVRAEWRGRSVREPLSVDIEEAVNGLREGAAAHLRATREARRVASTPATTFRASEVGERLFAALFKDSVRELLGASRATAEAERRTWRLCLRFQADELARVPWELLYDKGLRSFLAHRHPIVRLPWTGRRARPSARVEERRILWAGASPLDLGQLDLEREWRCLDRALRSVPEDDRPEVSRLEPATPEALLHALRDERHQILHFAGHGDFEGEEGALALCGPGGRAHMLRAADVAAVVADRGSPGVIVLNACEGATGRADDARTSVAALLAAHGVPAVVAMQTPIRDDFAAALTEHLYRGLAAGQGVEEAMIEARKALLALDPAGSDQGAWASPVLWMQWAEDAPAAAAAAAATGTTGAPLLPWILPVILWPRETVIASEPEHGSPEPSPPPEPARPPPPPGPPAGSKVASLLAAVAIGGALSAGAGYMLFCPARDPVVIGPTDVTAATTSTATSTSTTTEDGRTTAPPDTTTTSTAGGGAPPTSTGSGPHPAGPDAGQDGGGDSGATSDDHGDAPDAAASPDGPQPSQKMPLGSVTLLLSNADQLGKNEQIRRLVLDELPSTRAARCKSFTYCAGVFRSFYPVPKNGLQLVALGARSNQKSGGAILFVKTLPADPEKTVKLWTHKLGASTFGECKVKISCGEDADGTYSHVVCKIKVGVCNTPVATPVPTP